MKLQLHPNPITSFIPTLTNNAEDPSLFPSMLSIIGFLPAVRYLFYFVFFVYLLSKKIIIHPSLILQSCWPSCNINPCSSP